ncbi:transcription antitermination factor NusB [Algiphilus sp.]|uniref:transcription antitermination factor NusB n=1 Tax=Algiphilus sp. TaxID=1872431 RepID=UPI0025C13ADC|nr:transcription antitermination factor NusB [Algiphilus sp.]
MSDAERGGGKPQGQSRRGLARRLTVQALYQWLVNEAPAEQLLREFREEPGLGRADGTYFDELLRAITADAAHITQTFVPHLDRALAELDPAERAILMVGTYELMAKPDVPWRVVVNESVNLTKMFGGVDESYKFVNGVLDRVAHDVRSEHMRAGL